MLDARNAEAKPRNVDVAIFDKVMGELSLTEGDGVTTMITSHLFVRRGLFDEGLSLEEVIECLNTISEKAISIRDALKAERALQAVPDARYRLDGDPC